MKWKDLKPGDLITVEAGEHKGNYLFNQDARCQRQFPLGKRFPATFIGPSSVAKCGFKIDIRHGYEDRSYHGIYVTWGSHVLGSGNWELVAKINTEFWEAPTP